jgi:ferric-dicitrate binding protein FerR (iron transport regulator)
VVSRAYVTAPGQRETVTLRDGTHLVLGPATRLTVRGELGAGTRDVELDGEAVFTVAHDARRPFVVRANRTTMRDVGTVFVVRAYREDAAVRVAVAEGEVALVGASLRARDVATIDASGAVHIRRGVDVARYLAWTQGGLQFEDTPLKQVARDVGRAYGVEVTLADSALGGLHVTVRFDNQPLDVVLETVTRAVGARYEHTARGVVIRRGVAGVRDRGHGGDGPLMTTAQRGGAS